PFWSNLKKQTNSVGCTTADYEAIMLRTIAVGSFSLVQGIFIRAFPDGKIAVQVGSKTYKGHPVTPSA
ncbi:MAG: hypothetical protein AB3N09_07270, partial [Tateyamaria sp.]